MTLHENNLSTHYPEAEWQMRVDLAACYRVADTFGFSDIVWNHITAMLMAHKIGRRSRKGAAILAPKAASRS